MSCGGGHLGFPIQIKIRNFVEDLPMIIPGQFGFNCPSGFRVEAFWNIFPIGSNFKLSPFFMWIGNPRWPPPQDIDMIKYD
jgi:hypothetical protein